MLQLGIPPVVSGQFLKAYWVRVHGMGKQIRNEHGKNEDDKLVLGKITRE